MPSKIFLLAIYLLTLPLTSSAQCSWVLWKKTDIDLPSPKSDIKGTWEIIRSFDNKTNCIVDLNKTTDESKKSQEEFGEKTKQFDGVAKKIKGTSATVSILLSSTAGELSNGFRTDNYICLSDSIDPRPR